MKILITGSNGFIGKNLCHILNENNGFELLKFDRESTESELEDYCMVADAVFHFAAVLRPENLREFDDNIDLTTRLMGYLKKAENKCPLMFASSIQAELDNPYGECKRIEEAKIIGYGIDNSINTFVFRFPNLFGPMNRPNYTSVVATFCNNTVKEIPIIVNNPSAQIKFAYIETILRKVSQIVLDNIPEKANTINDIDDYYTVGLGELAYYMETLKREITPEIKRNDDFYEKLKQTYLWYRDNKELL